MSAASECRSSWCGRRAYQRADYVILRRVIDLYFESVFTNEIEDADETNHVYLKKVEYKELGFIEEHRFALFYYNLDNAPNTIYIPDSVKLRSREYAIDNDELLQWFKEFEITNDKRDHVTLKDLYSSFKLSDIWHNLDKNERRTNLNYKNFSENVKSNIKLRKLYKERTNKIKQVLIGIKQIEADEADSDSIWYIAKKYCIYLFIRSINVFFHQLKNNYTS